jgi:hypothetical protein
MRPTVTAATPHHPLDAIVVDRPRTDAARALAGAWLAYTVGVAAGGGIQDAGSFAGAAVAGAVVVVVGFAAGSRARMLASGSHRGRVALLTLAAGTSLGLFNLAANGAIAQVDPMLRALLVERFARITALDALVASPLLEEVTVRLFLMSAIAWVVFRLTGRATLAFVVALIASALFFASLHLFRPLPLDPALANYYRAALMAKYTLAGVVLGWVFWRWGLPYAIACHVVVNATHILLERFVFQ